ncbi:hypothetical protein CRG98_048470 [Punica granatum]|uniref:Uncharacterized protein n=1 Tax=Punica granatum TaxID=22663 RepID=A0A2I0HHH3_PUNGR|nr:hypothetical protein CRG98_048470 [Punica granatum]
MVRDWPGFSKWDQRSLSVRVRGHRAHFGAATATARRGLPQSRSRHRRRTEKEASEFLREELKDPDFDLASPRGKPCFRLPIWLCHLCCIPHYFF